MRTNLHRLALVCVGLSAIPFVNAQNVWLTEPGTLVITPAFTYQSYDKFRVGKTRMTLPDDIVQRTGTLHFDYGLAPRFALDASVGYTKTKFAPPGASFERSGRDDARVGLTYAIIEPRAEGVALTLRAGAIIEGNYDIPNTLPPINPGDGASGFETSLAAGTGLGGGVSLYGEFGYRNRNQDVQDDLFGNIGLAKQFGPVGLNVGYRRTQGLSGGDIGGPGFGTTYGFPQVKEITQFAEGGLSFTDRGGRSYQMIVARRVGALRNAGEATVYAFSVSLPLNARW
jgi:hypothetical protein